MNAFIDVSCPKCGKKFGWFGSPANRPPCPKCRHEISHTEKAALQAALEKQDINDFAGFLRARATYHKSLKEKVDKNRHLLRSDLENVLTKDVICAKCGHLNSWIGGISNWPACVKCAYKPTEREIANTIRHLEKVINGKC